MCYIIPDKKDLIDGTSKSLIEKFICSTLDPPLIAHSATKFWTQEFRKCKSSNSPQKLALKQKDAALALMFKNLHLPNGGTFPLLLFFM
jgi:hypothetical protein